jgi:hypothetical protein
MLNYLAGELKPLITALVETRDRHELYKRSMKAQARLQQLLLGKGRRLSSDEWEGFLNRLGLTSRPVSELFGKDSRKVRFLRDSTPDDRYTPSIECHTIRPAFRAGREGRQIEQVLVTLTQRVTADIGQGGERRQMVFRGGCSAILSLGDLNTVEYVILKNIRSYERFRRQAAYLNAEDPDGALPAASLYARDDRDWHLNFNLLHRH